MADLCCSSYTTFEFSNQQVQVQSPESYEAPTGTTPAAPTFGSISNNTEEVVVPANFSRIYAYIYPYLNSTSLEDSSGDPEYGIDYEWPGGAYDSSPQPYLPAGGAPGGNPALWDVLFNVTATITNNGTVVGDEVPQLYISLGGPNDAKVVLRDFDRLTVEPGQSVTFEGHITRRDLSNWDPVSQNWYVGFIQLECCICLCCTGSSRTTLRRSMSANRAGSCCLRQTSIWEELFITDALHDGSKGTVLQLSRKQLDGTLHP